MDDKYDLRNWVIQALKSNGNRGSIIDVSKFIWEKYEQELRKSGNLFYTWQYDVRWAATELRKTGKMKQAISSPAGVWELF